MIGGYETQQTKSNDNRTYFNFNALYIEIHLHNNLSRTM